MPPILTIRLELTGSQVLFNPSLDDKSASSSVQESVEGWLNDFLGRGDSVRPLDEDLKVQCDLLHRFPRMAMFSFFHYYKITVSSSSSEVMTINRNSARRVCLDVLPIFSRLTVRLKSCAAINKKN